MPDLQRMTDLEQRMLDDLRWGSEAAEVQNNPDHYGKLAAVHNKRLLGVGTERRALAEQAAKEVGVHWQEIVVVIVHRPGPWEIPVDMDTHFQETA